MDTEDFSFPRISENFACSIDSPPLWNLSPAGSPNPYQFQREGKKGDEEKDCFEAAKVISQDQRKSFSEVEKSVKKRMERLDDEEERMDLLWEDFNEELSSTTGSATSSSNSSSLREAVELRCAKALAVANKNNGVLVTNKNNKPGVVVIVKVLKKFFTLNNSQRKPRKRVL